MTWELLKNLVAANESFLICSHISPDGDSIGSQLAFAGYLDSLGKEVVIFNRDPLPRKFDFYPQSERITSQFPQRRFDVLVILDASNANRVGVDGIESVADSIINIDHHRDNSCFGTVNCVDPDAAAACQVVHRFFSENKIEFSQDIAECLYGGLLSDTGGFQFNTGDGAVFFIAADLAKHGVDCGAISKALFASYTLAGLKVRAKIWSSLQFYEQDQVAVLSVSESMIEEYGIDSGEIEGMSNLAMTAAGIEVGIFIKYSPNKTHFSLRSLGLVNVGAVAHMVSGGGHTCAAGCFIENMTYDDALATILSHIAVYLP